MCNVCIQLSVFRCFSNLLNMYTYTWYFDLIGYMLYDFLNKINLKCIINVKKLDFK